MARSLTFFNFKSFFCKVLNTLGISSLIKRAILHFCHDYKMINLSESTVLPWLNYPAINWLLKHLSKEMQVFEYGSGNSTIFWAKKVKNVVSIEHNSEWFKTVENNIRLNNLLNCNYSLYEPTHIGGQITECNILGGFMSASKKYQDSSFRDYCLSITRYPDNYFDIILVDGRARLTCLYYSAKKIKEDGFIILDNSERSQYRPGIKMLRQNGFKELDLCGYGPISNNMWMTAIFSKKEII